MPRRRRVLMAVSICASFALAAIAHGQSDPSNFSTVINFPGDPIPGTIGGGTQLNVLPGATDIPSIFVDTRGSSEGMSEVNYFGGASSNGIFALSNTKVNFLGGFVTRIETSDGADLKMTGGSTGSIWSNVNNPRAPSTASFSGGTPGQIFTRLTTVDITGGEFFFNGEPVAGLDQIGDTVSLASELADDDTLSGVLADGTPFVFSRYANDRIESGEIVLRRAALPVAAPIDLFTSTDPLPSGLRVGQSLTVDSILSERGQLSMGTGSRVHFLPGGIFGGSIEAAGAEISIAGGAAGRIAAYGSNLLMSGGQATTVQANLSSTAELTGGVVDQDFRVTSGSLTVSGGQVGRTLAAASGTTALISGGATTTLALGGDATITDVTVTDKTFVGGKTNYSAGDLGQLIVEPSGDFTMLSGSLGPFTQVAGRMEIRDGSVDRSLAVTGFSDSSDPNQSRIAVLDVFGGQIGEQMIAGGETGVTLVNVYGGSIDRFADALDGSTWNILGGIVGSRMDAFEGSVVNVTGGVLGGNFEALDGSRVFISGGTVQGPFFAQTGSEVVVAGGELGNSFDAGIGSKVVISDGEFGDFFLADSGSRVTISGGEFGRFMKVNNGADVLIAGGEFGEAFQAIAGSKIELIGQEFLLDGLPIPGLESPGDSLLLTTRGAALLTGTLANGDPLDFILDESNNRFGEIFQTDAMLTLTLVPEPSAVSLMVGCFLCLRSGSSHRQER